MQTVQKNDRASFALVFFLTVIGLAVRISAPQSASFPLNDGGLFYRMILDLQANHLALPSHTTYNNAAIPFAYPPFAFYVYALISSASHISLLKLMQFLPSIVSALTIPAFYLLATEILVSKTQSGLAALAFAFVPRGFDWLIMGGGVTRSLGLLFALLAMRQAYLLFSRSSNRPVPAMIGLGALVLLTHPEAAVHTAIGAIYFYLWKDRSLKGLMRAAMVAAGILLVTSPWWFAVIASHGLDPFRGVVSAAKQDSYNTLVGLIVLFRFNFTDEPHIALFTVFALVGLFTLLAKGKPQLPLWFLLLYTLEPRGGPLFMMIPMAMFAGVGLDQTLLPGLRGLNGLNNEPTETPPDGAADEGWSHNLLAGRTARIFIITIFLYTSLSAFEVAANIKFNSTLTNADLDALSWVKQNTPPGSKFAVVTQGLPLNDATSEWFPALTERTSLATVFGYEWVNDGNFGARVKNYQALQACATQDIDCLDRWAQDIGQPISYIYLRIATAQPSINFHLSDSADYKAVYETPTVVIFLRRGG